MNNWGIGIIAQIFILGIGLWMIKRILNQKYDPPNLNSQVLTKSSHDSICSERLNFITQNFNLKFENLNMSIKELKNDVKELRNLLIKE